jgi:hypothetical protein
MPFEDDRKMLIERFYENIKAHLNKDVNFILADQAPDFWVMQEGEITYPTIEEQRTRFTNYIENTNFHEYTSLMTPEIEFSEDGKSAWGKYRVHVKGESINTDGSKSDIDFVCAWVWLLKMFDGQWLRVGEVSTWR